MSEYKTAPLVEVIFEIRWGETSDSDAGSVRFGFDEEELTLFAGLFRSVASEKYPFYKKVNESLPHDIPHRVKHQFWRDEGRWPCLQIGLGIMTVNLTNDDYSWNLFKQTCVEALDYLDRAHHKGLSSLPGIGVELRYQDAFLLNKGESDSNFVKRKAQIEFDTPEEFLASELIEPVVRDHHVSFTVPAVKPEGELINKLDRALINGKDGFVQTTSLRSTGASKPATSIDSLSEWLDAAHQVQKHAYTTLIWPTHKRSHD